MCKIVAMRILTIAFTTVLLLVISGCGQSYNPERDKDCPGCDLIGVQLESANLSGAFLNGTNLSGANLTGANLFDATGADFSGAENVPPKYR